jgi:ribonuclease D
MTTIDAPAAPRVVHDDITPAFAAAAANAAVVGMDSETDGLDPASNRLLTVQVHVPGVGTEVVRVGPDRPGRLLALLRSPSTVKALHHAVFDLSFYVAAWDARPEAVRCTKVASKILNPEAGSHSLAPLLDRWLGVRLDKTLQTSDWAAGTLSDAQIRYAASDAEHLPALLAVLLAALENAGRLGLAAACWAHLPVRARLEAEGLGDVFAY